ncbi:VOC family protein [Nocardioides sp. CER19]|uniref:VOC family protein n=1 Tax=Nocardioides sp. CER19 TaxID=3038538 RepID=UPI00244C1D70|nr:VOC family protein [Nocardioides sp. CER19]MDH2414403.1 VOC family protein [Nocardioides sp. CER19]
MTIHSHTLHLTARGAGQASAWYQNAFGAEELTRLVVPGGRLIHVQLRIGSLVVMLADEFPEMDSYGPQHFGGTYGATCLHVDDVDAAWQRAVDAGAAVIRPLSDTFWGEREGQLLDPFGHRWGLAQHLRDVPLGELQELTTAAFSSLVAR